MKDTIEWSYPRTVAAQQGHAGHPGRAVEGLEGDRDPGRHPRPRPRQLHEEPGGRPRGGEEGQAPREEGGRRGRAPGLDRRRLRPGRRSTAASSPRSTTCRRSARPCGSGTRPSRPSTSTPRLLGSARTLRRLAEERAEARRRPRGGVPAAQLGAAARGAGAPADARSTSAPTGRSSATRSSRRRRCPQAQRIEAVDAAIGLTAGIAEADAQGQGRRLARTGSTAPPPGSATRRPGWRSSTGSRRRSSPTKDPFLDLAAALAPLDKQIRDAEKARDGRHVAARPGLHAGHARQGRRPRGPRRQLHAARHLRHREGGLAAGRRPLPAPDHAPGRGGQGAARRQGVRRAPGAARRGRQGARHRQGAVRGPEARRRAGRTSSPTSTPPAATPARPC